jgi:hypothetical protein
LFFAVYLHNFNKEGHQMEELEKIAIRLKHWAGHNLEHAKAYEEVAEKLTNLGLGDASGAIRQAIELNAKANEEFASALALIESRVGQVSGCCKDHESSHCCSDHDHGHHSH